MCKICHHRGITVALPIETWRPAAKELPVRVKLFPPGQPEPRPSSKKFTGETRSLQDVASVAKQTPRKWRNGIHLPFSGCPMSSRLIDTSHSQKEVSESNLRVNRIVVGLPSPWNSGKHQRLIPTPHAPLTMLPRIAKSIEPPQTLQKCSTLTGSRTHVMLRSFFHSFTHSHSLHSFSHFPIYSLIHSFIHLFTRSLTHPSIHPFNHSSIHSFMPSSFLQNFQEPWISLMPSCGKDASRLFIFPTESLLTRGTSHNFPFHEELE